MLRIEHYRERERAKTTQTEASSDLQKAGVSSCMGEWRYMNSSCDCCSEAWNTALNSPEKNDKNCEITHMLANDTHAAIKITIAKGYQDSKTIQNA